MGLNERKELYRRIESIRSFPLIVYVTSIRPGINGSMNGDVLSPIIDQIELISRDKDEIDFLIISNGGDPIASLRIMSLLRERFKRVNVLVPYVAYSAATVLSLGADCIYMHPYSNLGPVDPQLTVTHNNTRGEREALRFSPEDLRNYIDFVKTDVGITDQKYLCETAKSLIDTVGPLPIGSAKRGQMLTLNLSERMLNTHIDDVNKVKSISRALNSSYYHHGYAVGRTEAKEMGLPVVFPEEEFEFLLWKIWKDFELEMKCNTEFNPVKELMDDPDSSTALQTIPIVPIPQNIPEELKQQVYQNVLGKLRVTPQQALKRSCLVASVESTRHESELYQDFTIHYWREPDVSLSFNITTSASGWGEYRA